MELIVQYMGKLLLRNKWNKADVHRRLCTVDKLTKIRAGHLHQCSHQGVNDVEAINWTLTQWREFWNIGGLMVDATKIWGEFASTVKLKMQNLLQFFVFFCKNMLTCCCKRETSIMGLTSTENQGLSRSGRYVENIFTQAHCPDQETTPKWSLSSVNCGHSRIIWFNAPTLLQVHSILSIAPN